MENQSIFRLTNGEDADKNWHDNVDAEIQFRMPREERIGIRQSFGDISAQGRN